MEWYKKVLSEYFNFNGRARRKEFWMFGLINFLIYMGLAIVEWLIGTYMILTSLYGLAILIPSIAVGVRRMQDQGKSGLFLLIGLIPFLGGLILIFFFVQEGNQGPNEYGPDPKAMEAPSM